MVTPEQVTALFETHLAALLEDPNRSAEFKRRLGLNVTTGPGPERDKSKVLLDDYTFRRIDKFVGTEGTWPEWSFNVLMTVTQVDPKIAAGLEEIKGTVKLPLTDDMFKFISRLPCFYQ